MNTFTLGLIVIAYLLSLAYLGFLGYKKTTNTSDYLVGGRQMNPIVMALSYGATFISASAIVGFWRSSGCFRYGYSVAVFPQYVCRGSYRLHILRFAYPAHGSKTECQHFSAVIRPSFSFP